MNEELTEHATIYAKVIMGTFFATYVYTIITLGGQPRGGWIGAMAFLGIGIYAASIICGGGFFYVAKKYFEEFPGQVVMLLGILFTAYMTYMLTDIVLVVN